MGVGSGPSRSRGHGAARAVAVGIALFTLWPGPAAPQDASPPKPAAPAEYVIAVHISHNVPPATGPEEVDAIERLVTSRVALLNKAGGVLGRPVRAVFYDDFEDVAKTRENVAEALSGQNVIAMIGLWDSSRGAEVIDEIGESGVPLISELSVETLFSAYPNIYTLTRSVRHEQQVFQKFIEDQGYKRIAFVGADDDRYTKAYFDYIDGSATGAYLVAKTEGWLKRLVENSPERVEAVLGMVGREAPDLLFLSLGSEKNADFLRRLAGKGLSIPVFLGRGSVEPMQNQFGGIEAYRGPIYELAEGGIANLHNERLEQLMRQPRKLPGVSDFTRKAVSYGVRYGDLVALLAEAAGAGVKRGDAASLAIPAVRKRIADALARYSEGRKVWRGWAQDWSFTGERASSERSLLVWRPGGQTTTVLAPMQYVQTGTGLAPVPVLRVHLDMLRIYRVDTTEKSFEAEFFFTLRSDTGVPEHNIEFTNAFRGSGADARLVGIRQIHQEPAGTSLPTTRIFKVSGKFVFEPDLRKFPFDEQIFSISFQPENTASPFLLQPPSEQLMSYNFSVDGWAVRDRYVGSNDLIIRSVAGAMSEERIIPYYNFNYTWVMKRQVIDYVLRVLVPLIFILIVAYLANFIPRRHFDATIAIQVTALLSSIALYVALNQPSADDATLSDQIFVLAYALVSAMIAFSVFEVNPVIARARAIRWSVHVAQLYLLPLAAVGGFAYVIFLAASDTSPVEWAARMWRDLMTASAGHPM